MNNEGIHAACTGKTRYVSKGEAFAVIIHRSRARRVKACRGRGSIQAYRCIHCKFWHLGSNPL